MNRMAPFRYALQALADKQGWEVDMLAAELGTAQRAVREQEQEAARLRDALRQTNTRLAQLRGVGAILDPARERIVMDYRETQDEAIATNAAQLQAARVQCERIAEQLTRARLALRGFENHADEQRKVHAVQAGRAAAGAADEMWLPSRGGARSDA
jgi:flagellar biosynthesis chaperone FliJ